jgi:hypothetical protein
MFNIFWVLVNRYMEHMYLDYLLVLDINLNSHYRRIMYMPKVVIR